MHSETGDRDRVLIVREEQEDRSFVLTEDTFNLYEVKTSVFAYFSKSLYWRWSSGIECLAHMHKALIFIPHNVRKINFNASKIFSQYKA